jgi:hypothetical protein
VVGDEVFAAEEEVELVADEFLAAGELDGVGDDEQVVLVVLDLGEGAGRDAVLDGERVELKDALEDRLDLLVGRVVEIDPLDEPLVGIDEPESVEIEVALDQLAFVEDERADHGDGER